MNEAARILVVDDELAIRRFLDVSLKAQGYLVHLCASGLESLQTVTTSHPDLIILDLGLPDMDGLVFLKRLRE
jgi:two-component system, OmpR family, KDP operon response regulator KdpE